MCTHKSYIRVKQEGKWRHIVTVEEKQTSDHQQIVSKLFRYALRHPADKEALVRVKNDWMDLLEAGNEVNDLGTDRNASDLAESDEA